MVHIKLPRYALSSHIISAAGVKLGLRSQRLDLSFQRLHLMVLTYKITEIRPIVVDFQ
jgi:hypothetical protein